MVKENFKDLRMKKLIKIGSQFSGVGAFEQSLQRLGIEYENIYAADIDKYARQTYLLNFEEPKYYIKDVYDTPMEEITEKHGSLDIAMFSPPCQSFSLAGKRKGEDSKNGVLFYNSHEFIVKNNPRYFIFENVKGLLSDDSGKTFQRWIDMLGGKSVNGNPVIFPHENATPYHVYYQVMNAKHYGVPQNRERIFIIGIRDDTDNEFSFPKPFHLVKRLKDVLESEVDEKYFLSDKMLNYFDSRASNFNNGNINFKDEESVASTITSSSKSLDISDNIIRLANVNPSGNGMNGNVYGDEGVSPTLSTNKGEGIKVVCFGRSEEEKKRRKEHFQKTGQDSGTFKDKKLIAKDQDYCDTLLASPNPQKEGLIIVPIYTGIAVHPFSKKLEFNGFKDAECPTLLATDYKAPKCIEFNNQRIRRLTPKECFKLMDFNENFKWNVSDSQAYKQAGNSIVVSCLVEIIKKLNLK